MPKTEITEPYLNLTYTTGKSFLLGRHYWRFAKRITELSINGNIATIGWNYTYRIPANIGYIFDTVPHTKYDILGTNLVANITPLSLEYSAIDIDDSFPSDFGLLLSAWIAKEIITVVKVGGDVGLYNILNNQYKEMFLDAVGTDSTMIPSLEFRSNRYIDVR